MHANKTDMRSSSGQTRHGIHSPGCQSDKIRMIVDVITTDKHAGIGNDQILHGREAGSSEGENDAKMQNKKCYHRPISPIIPSGQACVRVLYAAISTLRKNGFRGHYV